MVLELLADAEYSHKAMMRYIDPENQIFKNLKLFAKKLKLTISNYQTILEALEAGGEQLGKEVVDAVEVVDVESTVLDGQILTENDNILTAKFSNFLKKSKKRDNELKRILKGLKPESLEMMSRRVEMANQLYLNKVMSIVKNKVDMPLGKKMIHKSVSTSVHTAILPLLPKIIKETDQLDNPSQKAVSKKTVIMDWDVQVDSTKVSPNQRRQVLFHRLQRQAQFHDHPTGHGLRPRQRGRPSRNLLHLR
jgi:hypothetical protein